MKKHEQRTDVILPAEVSWEDVFLEDMEEMKSIWGVLIGWSLMVKFALSSFMKGNF